MTAAEKLLQIVEAAKGDDLERCQSAFRYYSQQEMEQQFGATEQTRQEVLEDYAQERAEWRAAMDLLGEMLREREAKSAAPG